MGRMGKRLPDYFGMLNWSYHVFAHFVFILVLRYRMKQKGAAIENVRFAVVKVQLNVGLVMDGLHPFLADVPVLVHTLQQQVSGKLHHRVNSERAVLVCRSELSNKNQTLKCAKLLNQGF